ncbi:hypothetical protein KC338_g218 [Hortaea werneckii]|nr:hypothetical protein KC338_g218 [Hortaea werneckii]
MFVVTPLCKSQRLLLPSLVRTAAALFLVFKIRLEFTVQRFRITCAFKPAASTASWTSQLRSMSVNRYAASSTVSPTVRSPWFRRIIPLPFSPRAAANRRPSSSLNTTPPKSP